MKIFNIFILFVLLFSGSVFAIQPYENNFGKYFVRQGPGQCGPASFYMIFKYYGDDSKDIYFYKDSLCGSRVILKENKTRLMKDSDVSAFINNSSDSTDWQSLIKAVSDLYFADKTKSCRRYYSVDSGIYSDDKKQSGFIDVIYKEHLMKGRPVIVHLKRMRPFPGHYIVVVGYDVAANAVKYVDPNSKSAVIENIRLEDFAGKTWYKSKVWYWPNARWDGKWLGFYHGLD